MTKQLFGLIAGLSLMIAACTPADTTNVDSPQRPPVNAEEIDYADGTSNNSNIEARADSTDDALEGVTLILNDSEILAAQEGASNGALQLTLSFQNSGENDVVLPYNIETYALLDSAGIEVLPTGITDGLYSIDLGTGETVTGTVEYPVLDPTGTYTLTVDSFAGITIDASADADEDPGE